MRPYVMRILAALLLLLGVCLFMYPTAAGWTNQYYQSKLVGAYQEQVNVAVPDADNQLAMAHKYNNALEAGAVYNPNSNVPEGGGNLSAVDGIWPYEEILRAGSDGIMARLKVPSADVDLPVYHGTSETTLLKGVGHLEGTSLPVGGTGTRTVLTAHRGLADAVMFTHLDRVKVGDTFTIEVFGQVLTYRVFDIEVVAPEESQKIRAEEGRDLATLVTCTPLGINSHRILVTGERVYPTPQKDLDDAGKKSELPRFPWFIFIIGGALIATVGACAHSGRQIVLLKRREREEEESTQTSQAE